MPLLLKSPTNLLPSSLMQQPPGPLKQTRPPMVPPRRRTSSMRPMLTRALPQRLLTPPLRILQCGTSLLCPSPSCLSQWGAELLWMVDPRFWSRSPTAQSVRLFKQQLRGMRFMLVFRHDGHSKRNRHIKGNTPIPPYMHARVPPIALTSPFIALTSPFCSRFSFGRLYWPPWPPLQCTLPAVTTHAL